MIKYVIFNFDDTLAIKKSNVRYNHGQNIKTEQFNSGLFFKESEYIANAIIKNFISQIQRDYPLTKMQCVTWKSTAGIIAQKEIYLIKYYGKLFKNNIIQIKHEKSKFEYLQKLCAENNLLPTEILFIDSNYDTVRSMFLEHYNVALTSEILALEGNVDINMYWWDLKYCGYTVRLNNIDKINKFISSIESIPAEFILRSGKHSINAKSVMGIFALDITQQLELSIIAPNYNIRCQAESNIKPFLVSQED